MTELLEIVNDVLRQMYREADPPLDFDDVLENPGGYDEYWYLEHELEQDRQEEIIQKHCENHNLSQREKNQIIMAVNLGYGPKQKQ